MESDEKDYFAAFAIEQQRIKKVSEISSVSHDLDSVLALRVSSGLKNEFSKICKRSQSTPSSELKKYMLSIVKKGHL